MPERAIFRPQALEAYRQGTEKDVIPRLVYWPIILCFWLLLGISLAAVFFAWNAQVPTYLEQPGVIPDVQYASLPEYEDRAVLVFLPPELSGQVRAGLPVDVQIGAPGELHARGSIVSVQPDQISPSAAQKLYRLTGAGADLVTQPSIVLIIQLDHSLPRVYRGSLVTARIEIGSQRLLSLLPGLGSFLRSGL